MRLSSRFLRFCMVGCVGFAADAGLTLVLDLALGLAPLAARVPAFLAAATLTWALNRSFTFGSSAKAASWLPYVLLTSLGGLLNVGVYLFWISLFGHGPWALASGVAAGSVVALAFNYTVSRNVVFASAKSPRRGK